MKTSGLSLAEAHASGRKYRTSPKHMWFRFCEGDVGHPTLHEAITFTYELEPEAKLLTREEVASVVKQSADRFLSEHWSMVTTDWVVDKLFGSEEG